MKKIIIPVICIILIALTIVFINPITDTLASIVSDEAVLIINGCSGVATKLAGNKYPIVFPLPVSDSIIKSLGGVSSV